MNTRNVAVPVHRSVFETAAAHPNRLAIVEGARRLSYGWLAAHAAGARDTLRRAGVQRGSTVGIGMDRSAEMIAAVLGVLSAGAAYLPLDGHAPKARLDSMVRDANATCVIDGGLHTLPDIDTIGTSELFLDGASVDCDESAIDDIAYVMYTSGSTGRPKGVEVTHRNLAHFLAAMDDLLPTAAGRLTLFSTRLSFDIAGLELFLPLTTGGTCLIAPETWLPRGRALAALIDEHRPSLVQATPIGWRLLLEAGVTLGPEQTALCGGDVLPESLARRLAGLSAPSYNMYGPTEATIWATAWRIGPGPVRIGRPLAHADVHVLGDDLAPVPDGVEGEAYIGGPAVTRGYRGQPDLTSACFRPDPWRGGAATLYTTGDVVRVVDGQLQFLRRRDAQVKINGHRVELGEIETHAGAVTGVRAAVALVVGADVCVHVESSEEPGAIRRAVATRLREFLPPVMLPGRIDVLAELPMTANGKVDRAALGRRIARTGD